MRLARYCNCQSFMTILLPKLITIILEFLSTYLALCHGLATSGANNRKLLLPPATRLGQGNVLQASVILSTGGWGCLPQCMLGYHPLEQTPPRSSPPGADTRPPTEHAGRYGQRAGGTRPTGMQSCLIYFASTSM